MFITQLEYREKTTATNWRRMQFDKHMNFVSKDQTLPVQLLNLIASLTQFGAGKQAHQFANGIAAAIEGSHAFTEIYSGAHNATLQLTLSYLFR